MKLESLPPRKLRYRTNSNLYVFVFIFLNLLVVFYWLGLLESAPAGPDHEQIFELPGLMTGLFYLASFLFYLFFVRSKMKRSLQVFEDHILVSKYNGNLELYFEMMEGVTVICWSIFAIRMKDGSKHYFHSKYERVDYIWEGVYHSRPDLIEKSVFEEFRIKLVQYDHYQKRKEWFLKHKFIDLFNWIHLPSIFLSISYIVQSRNFQIAHGFVYFFRLYLYALLTLVVTSFIFSLILKKFVFDKKVKEQIFRKENKTRDVDSEGHIVEKVKIFKLVTSTFLFFLMIKFNLNMYSLLRLRSSVSQFDLKKGETLIVDNRYNCFDCKHSIQEGDLIVYGKGQVGELIALEEDVVGEVFYEPSPTLKLSGRSIASTSSEDEVAPEERSAGQMIRHEKIYTVPFDHVAVKSFVNDEVQVVLVKKSELIGRVKK